MFGLGFFDTVHLVAYIVVICMLLVSAKAAVSLFVWLKGLSLLGVFRKGIASLPNKKAGKVVFSFEDL